MSFLRAKAHLLVPESVRVGAHEWSTRANGLLRFGAIPLHRDERYAPVFIVGAPRSGNTLLRRVLAANPALSIPPETYVLGTAVKAFRANRHLPWTLLVDLVLSQFEFHPEFHTMNVPTLGPLAVELKARPRDRRSLAAILDGFYRFHAESNGTPCTRWGDKTPANVSYVRRLDATFPDAQYIHLVRDGYDAIYSTFQLGNRSLPESIEIWRRSVRIMRGFARDVPERVLEVRYESLATDPETTVKSVCGFLGLSFEPAMLASEATARTMGDVTAHAHHRNVGRAISTASIGKGRDAFTAAERRLVTRRIASEQRTLRYRLLDEQ
jgi:LPS sulfotransferase NodH